MEKPIEPDIEDCCNSGCNPCIFDIYETQLKLYKNYLDSGGVTTSEVNGISQLKYTQFIVVENVVLCHLHHFITLRKMSSDEKKVWWRPGDHFLYKYTSTETPCTRAYTPIKVRNDLSKDYDFSIIVKQYDNGLVSTHLCNLNEGDITLWRGPYGHYKLETNKFSRLIMIAQGTGIAPFVSIIYNILNNEDDMSRILLLYCCKSEDTILFRDELYAFRSYWNFKYEVFCSTSTNINCRYQEPIKNHKLNIEYLMKFKPFSSKDQFLLCGSPQFIEAYDSNLRRSFPEIENIVLF